jgi:hypothetical protein
LVVSLLVTAAATPVRAQQCAGDCNGDGMVAINELVTGVGIVLSSIRRSLRGVRLNVDGEVTINEIHRGQQRAQRLSTVPLDHRPG